MTKQTKLNEQQPRLGRGLAALLRIETLPSSSEAEKGLSTLPLELLRPNSRNPRSAFDEDELRDLAESIKVRGILQPILVRLVGDSSGDYEIVAGERRWRAAQRAGLHSVPVRVLELTDKDVLEISIIENVQRSDLSTLEEAKAYARLSSEYGYNHTDIGRVVGKSRSYIANTLRLLALPTHSQELLASGALTAGHARALLPLPNADSVADSIVANRLTVREVEDLNPKNLVKKVYAVAANKPDVVEIESRLSLHLGMPVTLLIKGSKTKITMVVNDLEQLNKFCDRLLSL